MERVEYSTKSFFNLKEMTIAIILAVASSIFFLWICLKRPSTTYSFQVFDNKNQYIYTKRITAKTEFEVERQIQRDLERQQRDYNEYLRLKSKYEK